MNSTISSTLKDQGDSALEKSLEPIVTLVVVPRERFSCARQSLESIYAHTTVPFKLIYVDGNSPTELKHYLQAQAQQHGFELLRTEYYLYPNQARNLGLQRVTTPYLVFVDNDVVVSPGWLEALLRCAEETEAAVVGPLMCQHEPLHQEVHFAGGQSHIWVDKTGRRRLREKMYDQGKQVDNIRDRLKRSPTELAEFHCVLVRRSIFDQLGELDPQFFNTKEHLDFCMSVQQNGGSVYFEPDSLVTYLPGPPQNWADVHFYMLRWSDDWTIKSLERMRDKWNLVEDGYFKNKYKKIGWRRYMSLIHPMSQRLTFNIGSDFVARAIAKLEHGFNHYLTSRHRRIQAKALID
ncbi:MAG: glycosyltransferase [Leptolyngbyaceae cyanobacterium SM1_1_3]|nr:glycosyltransferase [Leptolyngbyaceae cyanobacterium SM1_1_3]NJM85139.1 glycosyltransferase [Leptolyngbyaceae cyanobacterium RM2_2_21]NJN02234.1 glycosyltransferase [Leptolyngbyaceae cyanobacterium RM1_1_2]NJO09813.1 glycosyltransferase [Leptolyngbyaceae cyanobacterium SL_1_1]